MIEQTFSCGYGAILKCDAEVIERCLVGVMDDNPGGTMRVLEIGMHDGGTAKGMEAYAQRLGCSFEYTGIDPDDGTTRPRYTPANATVITGDSLDVHGQVPEGLDLVLVDGCHCFRHVTHETLIYGPKVRVGGFLLYHDVNPRIQLRTDEGYQYHGDRDDPLNGIAVLKALEAFENKERGRLVVPGAEFEPFMLRVPEDPDRHDCGMLAYRRVE